MSPLFRARAPWGIPVLALALIGGCGPAPSEEKESDATPPASQSPAMPAKLVFAFQRQKDPAKLKEDAEALGAKLKEALGIPVEVVVPTAYSATVQALISRRADIAYLSSLPYILASREAKIEPLLVERREGSGAYDSLFVIPKDSPVQTLADLQGKKMAFTSATSSSGYVFPYGHLVQQGHIAKGAKPDTFFKQAVFAGGYDKALIAVTRGQADVAAVSDYTMEGETADKYLPASERAKLRILARVPGVPTHLIAVRSDLPEEIKEKVRQVLLDLSKTDKELLTDVYGASSFAPADADHVAAALKALQDAGLDPQAVVE